MKLPEEINIVGNVYRVVGMDTVISSENHTLFGEISYTDREIRIKTKKPCPDFRTTLIHEIIHGCCTEGGIELNEDNVTRFANILTDTLVRNGLMK